MGAHPTLVSKISENLINWPISDTGKKVAGFWWGFLFCCQCGCNCQYISPLGHFVAVIVNLLHIGCFSFLLIFSLIKCLLLFKCRKGTSTCHILPIHPILIKQYGQIKV